MSYLTNSLDTFFWYMVLVFDCDKNTLDNAQCIAEFVIDM